ncbi:MAG: ATP-binding cassette domain-containing protein [Rickettsiales bacterium]
MIIVKNLCKSFGSKIILQDINLEIPEKKALVILGQSGTGKSILIKSIIGIIEIDSGFVKIDDNIISNKNLKQRLKLMSNFGFLFQYGALFDSMNILDNITFFANANSNISIDEKIKITKELLDSVELSSNIMYMLPSELSGGMQKRVALARAIAAKPRYVFLDEPTTGLDPVTSHAINKLIVKLIQEYNLTTVTITHSISSAKMIGDNIIYLQNQGIKWQGTKEEFINTEDQSILEFIKYDY